MFDSAVGKFDWVISEKGYLFSGQFHPKGSRNKTPSMDVIKGPATERVALNDHFSLNVIDQDGGRNPRMVNFWYTDLTGEFHTITYKSAAASFESQVTMPLVGEMSTHPAELWVREL